MLVHGIRCKRHNIFLYSRANHDFHTCSECAKLNDNKIVAIDGGQDSHSTRVIGNQDNWEFFTKEVNATLKDFYEDWNTSTNKYGEEKL